ncbi:uncharacterized protein LOC124931887 [Impatiens glandulifera]|uniref:uncharacterized protein LOC124931887 n=1 Tax=Impatiens glandulifera TaxID=253017 RepID=UPI001FB0F04F|nr:uncharacterized protein LOC124931887 [Impatiens glandulifera]
MGGSRRNHKRHRPKVQVGLPRKNPNIFKPAFCLPPKLRSMVKLDDIKWDDKGSVLQNYKSFGVVSNPNLLSIRSRSSDRLVESDALQIPQEIDEPISEFDTIDSGSDLEEDDLKTALGKKRRDGKGAPAQPLTTMQRVHIGKLTEKYGDDYKGMFMDTKLNKMQHSIGTLESLCKRYHMFRDGKNPLLIGI